MPKAAALHGTCACIAGLPCHGSTAPGAAPTIAALHDHVVALRALEQLQQPHRIGVVLNHAEGASLRGQRPCREAETVPVVLL